MNITTFKCKDFNPGPRRGNATIRVQKTKLAFSQQAVAIIGLKTTDKVLVHQDNVDPGVWYISKDPEGFPLKSVKKSKALLLYNSKLADVILTAFEVPDSAFNFEVSTKVVNTKSGTFWKLTVEE